MGPDELFLHHINIHVLILLHFPQITHCVFPSFTQTKYKTLCEVVVSEKRECELTLLQQGLFNILPPLCWLTWNISSYTQTHNPLHKYSNPLVFLYFIKQKLLNWIGENCSKDLYSTPLTFIFRKALQCNRLAFSKPPAAETGWPMRKRIRKALEELQRVRAQVDHY